jgi:hypothetical protein
VGQRLTGRLLRWEGEGLGLVNIQGHELTALVASNPAPGQNLCFVVERLYPDVVLKELHGGPGGDPGPAVLFNDFRQARAVADKALSPLEAHLKSLELADPLERKRAFFDLAARDKAVLPPMTDLLASIQALNALLEPTHGATLASPSWLLPQAKSRELLTFPATEDQPQETQFFCILPRLGRCEVRMYALGARLSLKVFTEVDFPKATVAKLLTKMLPQTDKADFLGAFPLPPQSRAGIVARLLGLDSSASFSFERRV